MNINFSGKYVLTTPNVDDKENVRDTIHPWENNAELNESVGLIKEKAAKKELPVDTLDLGNYVYVFTGVDATSKELAELQEALEKYQKIAKKADTFTALAEELTDEKKALNEKKSWSASDGVGDFLKSRLRQSRPVKKVLSDVKLSEEKQGDLDVFERNRTEQTHARVDAYNELDAKVTELATKLGEGKHFEVSDDFNKAVKKGKFDLESGVMLKRAPIKKMFSR